MGQPSARHAEARDEQRLAELVSRARIAREDARDGRALAKALPLEMTDLERYLEDEDKHVLVGSLEEHLVGLALASEQPEHGALVLDLLYVEESSRRRGVGRAIAMVLEELCHERGLVSIDALSLPGDRATKAFLESMGFRARLITMRKHP
jgi:GNAT superfamily N-acetyltransferase